MIWTQCVLDHSVCHMIISELLKQDQKSTAVLVALKEQPQNPT